MAFSRAVFTVLLLSVVCKAYEFEQRGVPVFLWGNLAAPSTKSNPLSTTTSHAFSDILSAELADDPFTVVFVEETLSNEDFSSKNAYGETSFPYLKQNLIRSVYLPSVVQGIQVLDLIKDAERVQLTEDGLSSKISENGRFLIIKLEDAKAGESRADLLLRHNDFMKTTVEKLQKTYPDVVAIYTGAQPSWTVSHSRVRRQAESNTTDYVLDNLRLYASRIKLFNGDVTTDLHGLTSSSSVLNVTEGTLNSTLHFNENSIVLSFKRSGGYWFFESVTLNPSAAVPEVLHPNFDVYSLEDWSFRCGQNVSFQNGNSSNHLYFEDLKVQPFFNPNSTVVFGDSFNCIGFFSAPIWSGLFVVFILLAIMFYGIIMMLDIRTMDRFDDPKGKTITINAGE